MSWPFQPLLPGSGQLLAGGSLNLAADPGSFTFSGTPAELELANSIEFVGWVGGTSTDTAIVLDLTALTGGIGTAAAENDIVVFVHLHRGTVDQNVGTSTSGYAEVADLYANASAIDPNLSVNWKRMGSTPDTSVTSNVITGRNTAVAYVLRGVDTTTALDVTSTTSTNTATGVADPPAITPTTARSLIVAVSGDLTDDTSGMVAPPTGLWPASAINTGPSTHQPHIGIVSYRWESGSFDPGTWTGHVDRADHGSAAVTLAFRPQPAPTGLSLAADAGAFTFSGVAANLELGREINATSGAFTFNGAAADLELGREVVADLGAFAFTGVAADLEHGREVQADAGSFAFTGTDADLVLAADKTITADPGAFTFTGQAADLEYGRLVVADTGTFVFNGQAADLELGREVVADQGTFLFTGQAADLELGREVVADSGLFAFAGADAALILAGEKVLAADPGAFLFTGTSAELQYTPTAGQVIPPPSYGGGGAPIWSEVSWFKKKKKPRKEKLVEEVAEVVEQAVPAVTRDESRIVALRLVNQITYEQLRQIETLQAFIERVEAELAEMDDEEVLLLAA